MIMIMCSELNLLFHVFHHRTFIKMISVTQVVSYVYKCNFKWIKKGHYLLHNRCSHIRNKEIKHSMMQLQKNNLLQSGEQEVSLFHRTYMLNLAKSEIHGCRIYNVTQQQYIYCHYDQRQMIRNSSRLFRGRLLL